MGKGIGRSTALAQLDLDLSRTGHSQRLSMKSHIPFGCTGRYVMSGIRDRKEDCNHTNKFRLELVTVASNATGVSAFCSKRGHSLELESRWRYAWSGAAPYCSMSISLMPLLSDCR